MIKPNSAVLRCPDPESNQGHGDFQAPVSDVASTVNHAGSETSARTCSSPRSNNTPNPDGCAEDGRGQRRPASPVLTATDPPDCRVCALLRLRASITYSTTIDTGAP